MTLYQTAVHHAPEDAAYHVGLGKALSRDPASAREAIQMLERATQLAPKDAAGFAELAMVMHRQGLRLRAQRALEAAVRLSPNNRRVVAAISELGELRIMSALRISSEALTDVGRKRKGNEDAHSVDAGHKLYVVADGMGGHAAGEVASRIAVDSIGEFVALTAGNEEITWPFGLDETISYDGNRLKTAIRHANRKVLEATRENAELEGMATTVAAVLVDGDIANIAHVGDSRIYKWSDGEMTLLTSDHSWVNEQIQTGVISAEQARSHPLRNVVTRALGGRADLLVDIQALPVKSGEVLLLCSDGLTTMLPDEDIVAVLERSGGDISTAARDLVDEANERGGEDNITVVLMKFED